MWYTERILSEDLKQVLQSNIKYLRVRAPFPEGDGLYIVAEYLQVSGTPNIIACSLYQSPCLQEFLGGVAAQRHCDFFFRCRELEVIEVCHLQLETLLAIFKCRHADHIFDIRFPCSSVRARLMDSWRASQDNCQLLLWIEDLAWKSKDSLMTTLGSPVQTSNADP